jgi:hypothetical protein
MVAIFQLRTASLVALDLHRAACQPNWVVAASICARNYRKSLLLVVVREMLDRGRLTWVAHCHFLRGVLVAFCFYVSGDQVTFWQRGPHTGTICHRLSSRQVKAAIGQPPHKPLVAAR